MKQLERASIPQSEIDRVIEGNIKSWLAGDPALRKAYPFDTVEEVRPVIVEHTTKMANDPVYRNDTYQVSVREIDCVFGPMVHLSIKRIDRETIHDWRDLQEIKNQLCGAECEGIELYPAECRRVDIANQYHLWVVKEPGIYFPLGFGDRFVTEDSIAGSKQRPL